MFFLIVCSLFPIGISPDPARLGEIASGVLWISALLASLLAMDSLYRNDFEDGSLEQLLLSPHPLYFLVLAKNMAHWLVSGLPVVIVSPLVAYMLSLPGDAYGVMFLTLLLGTPILSLLGSIGVALTVGLGSRGLILAVITLPMSVPCFDCWNIDGSGGIEWGFFIRVYGGVGRDVFWFSHSSPFGVCHSIAH